MAAREKDTESRVIHACVERLREDLLAPWKVEEELETSFSIDPPENFRIAALCRQHFIKEITGKNFRSIHVPDKPYKTRYLCAKENLVWELDIRDENHTCSLCASELKSLDQFAPLVANYVGGQEDYFSYAGQIAVTGDRPQNIHEPPGVRNRAGPDRGDPGELSDQ